jgi:hypothetical protein
MKEKKRIKENGISLIKMKLEKSMAEKFFSPRQRHNPNYLYDGG